MGKGRLYKHLGAGKTWLPTAQNKALALKEENKWKTWEWEEKEKPSLLRRTNIFS